MVRRDLRGWLGLGALVLVVIALTLIAMSRVEESPGSIDGRWRLLSVETPEGTFEPEDPEEWIEFDGSSFRGHMTCIDFEGQADISGNGFSPYEWSSTSGDCANFDGTGYAFDTYFHEVGVIRVDSDLTMQSLDGSVQFVFTREDASAGGSVRAW